MALEGRGMRSRLLLLRLLMEDIHLYVMRWLKVAFGSDAAVEERSIFIFRRRCTHDVKLFDLRFLFLRCQVEG